MKSPLTLTENFFNDWRVTTNKFVPYKWTWQIPRQDCLVADGNLVRVGIPHLDLYLKICRQTKCAVFSELHYKLMIKREKKFISCRTTALHVTMHHSLQIKFLSDSPCIYIAYYYSFKIFPHFWLAKTTCIIHHNQLLWPNLEEFCHIGPTTQKVQQHF